VAEDEQRLVAGAVLRRQAPEERRRAEQAEKVAGHVAELEQLGIALAEEGPVAGPDPGDALEAGGAATELGELEGRAGRAQGVLLAQLVPEEDEPVGVAVRQRVEEHRLDDGEDGAGAADAERQREHRDQGEAGRLPHASQRVARIPEPAGGGPGRRHRVADVVLDSGHAAQLLARLALGLVGRHAAPLEVGGAVSHVRAELLVDLPLQRAPPEDGPEGGRDPVPEPHGQPLA
jgi:hypothetical protein